MSRLVHRLTAAADLRHVTVVCGTATPDQATWLVEKVTCPRCLRPPCTCGPSVPVCPACRAWNAAHRGRPTRLPALRTEKAFQEAVRERARAYGWLYYHTFDARKSPAGYVDCTLVRDGRLLCAELKMPGKRPTPAQQAWLEALWQVERCETYLWYPDDMHTIEELLR